MDAQVKETDDTLIVSTPLYLIVIKKNDWTVFIKPSQASKYSKHQALVLRLVQQLIDEGVVEINADGITELPLNKHLSLACGAGRADLVFVSAGITSYVEVETSDRLGRQTTSDQLIRLSRASNPVLLAVPLAAVEEAHRILRLIGLNARVQVLPIE